MSRTFRVATETFDSAASRKAWDTRGRGDGDSSGSGPAVTRGTKAGAAEIERVSARIKPRLLAAQDDSPRYVKLEPRGPNPVWAGRNNQGHLILMAKPGGETLASLGSYGGREIRDAKIADPVKVARNKPGESRWFTSGRPDETGFEFLDAVATAIANR